MAAIVLLIVLVSLLGLQNVDFAIATPISQIPPKVNVPEMNVNATISKSRRYLMGEN